MFAQQLCGEVGRKGHIHKPSERRWSEHRRSAKWAAIGGRSHSCIDVLWGEDMWTVSGGPHGGPVRIQYKCLVPIYVYSQKCSCALCSLLISKTEL